MNSKIKHLGLIPDGGRRWARENNKSIYESYLLSMHRLGEIIDSSFDAGVQIQSIYCLGKENMKRKSFELEAIYSTGLDLVTNTLPKICDYWKCRVYIVGLIDLLPSNYQKCFIDLATYTQSFSNRSDRKLYLLTVYDPWEEIRSAIRKSNPPENFRDYLWVKENVDLVIRTGKGSAMLMSNFLPLQSGFAEYFLIEKYFNDVQVSDVLSVINDFPLSRNRLVGK